MRIRPTLASGLILGIGYIAMITGLGVIGGGDITDFASPAAIQPHLVSFLIASVVLVVVTTALGWWPSVLRDRTRLGGPARFIPWVIVAALVVGLVAYGGLGSTPTETLLWTAALVLLVGFCEELAFRGLVLTGARGSTSELNAWLISSVLFGLLHLGNALTGEDLAQSGIHVLTAFVSGSLLYMVRRTTGFLVAAMLVHALFDFTALTSPGGEGLPFFIGIVVLVYMVVRRREVFADRGSLIVQSS